MITAKDLNKVIFSTNNNPIGKSIHVEVQCEYGFKKYSNDTDVSVATFVQDETSLEKEQDRLLEEIVNRINKSLESNDV